MIIKDNCEQNKTAFDGIPKLTSAIADKTLDQLEREGVFVFPDPIARSDDITGEQMVLQSINDSYRTGNVMGFLGCGQERLNIQSRFSNDSQDYFFQYILSKALRFPNLLDMDINVGFDNRLYDLLMFIFPHYLITALRKGLFRTYIKKQYNDSNVKGAIDIARHIKTNTPFIGRIAYNQREFSYDNYLTELIRHTIEYILTKPYGRQLLRRAKDERDTVIGATTGYTFHDRKSVIAANRKNPIRHAFYHEYRALQRLCIKILQNEKHQIGADERIHGILFDGAWLWEEYVHTIIEDKFYHPMNKAETGAQYLFANSKGKIYPDFISKSVQERIIADAKYKPVGNIGNDDYLQILAYMFRFDAKKGLYIYPESGEKSQQTLFLNSGTTYENNVEMREDTTVIKYGLVIPNAVVDYMAFQEAMVKSEATLKMRFADYVNIPL